MSTPDEASFDVITAEEVDRLILEASATSAPPSRSAGPLPFDFRRPNKFNREHVRALQIVHETFARQFGTILSTTLRTVSQVSLSSVDQLSYEDYVRATPNPSLLALLSLEPLSGAGMFQLPLSLALTAVDRLLGGDGTGDQPERALTDIEAHLAREVLERALHELAYAFESLVPIQPRIVGLESNPQFAQIAAPTDMVVVMTFSTRIGTEEGTLTLCIPFASLQGVLERVAAHSLHADRHRYDPIQVAAAVAARIEATPVEVSLRFPPVTLTSHEIVGLQPGDVIPLRHDAQAPLTVAAAGVSCLAAIPANKGRRLACRIVDPTDQGEQ